MMRQAKSRFFGAWYGQFLGFNGRMKAYAYTKIMPNDRVDGRLGKLAEYAMQHSVH